MATRDALRRSDPPAAPGEPAPSEARERIFTAAYELFSRRGIRAVGIDAIIERSGVARQTLYRHFASKQELVLAFLARREDVWTKAWLQAEVMRRAEDPAGRMLAVFDVFDEWFRTPDFEGCSFINVMLEHTDADDPIRMESTSALSRIRAFIEGLAREAGAAAPDDLAAQWHILMKGSIVAAGEGDHEAGRRAQRIARMLLEQEGIAPPAQPSYS